VSTTNATIAATGRRKTAVARVVITPGEGKFLVNKKPFEGYFKVPSIRQFVEQPFTLTGTLGKYDVTASVKGGGDVGQAGAVRHALTRALVQADASLRPALKTAGCLTRDPRMKERKKPGRPGARRRFQFSKR
jgi:small subunit ribosomal protein S9